MPRKIHSPGTVTPRQHSQLVDELARELKTVRESGQPFIDEEHFETNAIRVVVLRDRWAEIPEDDRFDVIFNAYRTAEGETYANRIGPASGLTIPEAYASGMLPFQIVTGMRRGDSVTFDQCRRAMIEQGASTLLDPAWPQLRFATKRGRGGVLPTACRATTRKRVDLARGRRYRTDHHAALALGEDAMSPARVILHMTFHRTGRP